ncbi:hypothetical protein BD289DRAFT_239915 [Coniella lustricola]|uniref:C2H2-type domain-containing protein n=1 Tax=Coniella lustricola TaxID=2025994 RepID=A0A2T3ALA1_9PEZI|nr:hypothetical protein BD289DRAFT_239915 [Coniella lustricola]
MAIDESSIMTPSAHRGLHTCKYCEAAFDTKDELLAHKKDKLSQEAATKDARLIHTHCSYCDTNFGNLNTLSHHFFLMHKFSKPQDIVCPGCERHFNSVSQFILHLENKECTKITFENATARYKKNIEFSAKLDALDNQRGSWRQHKDFSLWLGRPYKPEVPRWTPTLGEEPDLSAWDLGEWDEQNQDRATTAVVPASRQAEAQQKEPLQNPALDGQSVDHDPKSPEFNAARFFNKLTKDYDCPKAGCRTRTKSKQGLVQHLLSPKHAFYKDAKSSVGCPACHKCFNTLSGLAAHVEHPGQKCGMHTSDIFEIFVWQMTWGIIEVKGRDSEFLAPTYGASTKAKEDFGAAETVQPGVTLGRQQEHSRRFVTASDIGRRGATASTTAQNATTDKSTQFASEQQGFFLPRVQDPLPRNSYESRNRTKPDVGKAQGMLRKLSIVKPEAITSSTTRSPAPKQQQQRTALTLDALQHFDKQDKRAGGFYWSTPEQKKTEDQSQVSDDGSTTLR